jgi:SAM-dependent methyltransferase
MAQSHRVRVWPLPPWLYWQRLLGPGNWSATPSADQTLQVTGELSRDAAADLEARLRGVSIGGTKLMLEIAPKLHRPEVRKARLEEARRYRKGSPGFSQHAVQLNIETKRSLTPEALAQQIGQRAKGLRVIDACCGAGGNTIGFARAGCTVTAIDLMPEHVGMAKYNATLYGVANRIEFMCGDAQEIVPRLQGDLLFIDPPWGAQFDTVRITLSELPPLEALVNCSRHLKQLWAKVPPAFDPTTLPGCSTEAFFGVGEGDKSRVKFLLLQLNRAGGA